MKVAVLGLGRMGLPVAAALASQGMDVLAYDSDPARVALALAQGARGVAGAVAAFAAPIVLTLLPDDAALTDACMGPDGLLARVPAGAVHVCIGTLGVASAQALEAAHAKARVGFIACPVFGRPDEAWECDLTAVFGPSAATGAQQVALARTVVRHLAPRLHEVASPAAACAVKLAGNQMIATAVASMTECFGLAQAHGVSPQVLHAVVTGKLFRGPVYEGVGRVLAGAAAPPPVPGFTLRLGLKDVKLCAQAAADAGHAMPVADAVRARLADAVEAGHGERDWAELPHCLSPQTMQEP